jgi:C1A family cysteine protease
MITRKLGWKRDKLDERDYKYSAVMPAVITLPPSVNLVKEMPEIWDQGNLGSCVFHGVPAAIWHCRYKQNDKPVMPSRLFSYYNTRVDEGSVYEDAGAEIRDAVKNIARLGICPENEWPYIIERFADEPDAKCYKDALKFQILEYRRINLNLTEMKTCLAEGYPFVFGVMVYSNFPMDTTTGTVKMPGKYDYAEGGHCLLAVGYNDKTKRFTFRNSWGEAWGKKGYGTIPYKYLTDPELSADFWTIRACE